MKDLVEYLIEKWDWFIYAKAVNSVRRMCQRNPAFGYIFLLQMQDWIKENPMPNEIKESAESFYESMKELKNKRRKL